MCAWDRGDGGEDISWLRETERGLRYHKIMWRKSVRAIAPIRDSNVTDGDDRVRRARHAVKKYHAEHEWDVTVDFVVVGAGSAGCAVAGRLATSTPEGVTTMLLEAGIHNDIPQIQTAVDYFGKVEEVFGSERDWLFNSEPQTELNGRGFYWPRGKVVGGCSSFNTMVWMRGDPQDYMSWEKILGCKMWGHEEMTRQFVKIETHPYFRERDAPHHGGYGPITIAPLSHAWHHPDDASHKLTREFIEAAVRLGFPRNDDFGLRTLGVGPNDVNAFGGQRCSAAAYLKMAGAYPTNSDGDVVTNPSGSLIVSLRTHVLRIVFDDKGGDGDKASKRAVGVVCQRSDGTQMRVRARREIVLSAGACNSPHLLMLSGVGPREHLEEKDIECVVDLPGVGFNLRDHLHVPMCYRIEDDVVPHSHSNICEGSLFTALDSNSLRPQLQVHCGIVFFDPTVFSPEGEGMTLTPSLIHPKSFGHVRLRSADPFERPLIEANYLSDENGEDLRTLVMGVKLVRELGREMLEVGQINGREVYPGPSVQSDEDIEEYVRNHVNTMYHPACTCRMGTDDDPMAVLDAELCVRGGVQGLRVADASSMPEIVGANTNATCVAIGEKCAELLIKRHYRTASLSSN